MKIRKLQYKLPENEDTKSEKEKRKRLQGNKKLKTMVKYRLQMAVQAYKMIK